MTGRELIVYILENNLEDEDIFKNGVFIGFMSESQTAAKFAVGIETVRLWHKLNMLNGVEIGGSLYFPKTIKDPRRSDS